MENKLIMKALSNCNNYETLIYWDDTYDTELEIRIWRN